MLSPPRAFAIIPAAGESTRMGRPKLLLPWRGKPLLTHVLEAWKRSRISAMLVVVQPDDVELAALAESAGALIVRPPLPPPDMRASVAFGLGETRRLFSPHDEDAWMVAPADMPRLSAAVIDRLIEAHTNDRQRALVPALSGRRGHPVLFPWHWSTRLRQLSAEQGLNALLDHESVHQVDCSDLVDGGTAFADIDTPQDFQQLPE